MKTNKQGENIMEKLTTQEFIATFKNAPLSTIRDLICNLEEQLTWKEDDRFIPTYTKEDIKGYLELLVGLEKEKYEEEQKAWFYYFSK
tara:strand:+ start:474 stop:737 length:264 start_codon:yes stop_codon:yes gene_type:complete